LNPIRSGEKLDKSDRKCIIKIHLKRRGDEMTKPARRNFYLTDLQLKRLNTMSKKLGLAASEILRRAIDEYWERFEKKERSKIG
jgi:hypothetical protein